MILGRALFQSTIHSSGVLFLITIGSKCYVYMSVNMTSLFVCDSKEYASVHNEVMRLRIESRSRVRKSLAQ
jgi:hypothetical protein